MGCYQGVERLGVGCLTHHQPQLIRQSSTPLPLQAPELPGLEREPRVLVLQPLAEPWARERERGPPWWEPFWAPLPAQAPWRRLPQGQPSASVQPGAQRWRTVL